MSVGVVCPVGKLEPQGSFDQLIERPRLLESIRGNTRHVCLQGKMGQGKTSLAGQLFLQTSQSKMWYQFDSEDNDGETFCRRFTAALIRVLDIDVGLPENAQDQLGIQNWVDQVAVALESRSLLIFLEDFHFLNASSESRAVIFQLIRLTASSCKFVITTRFSVHELEPLVLRDEALVLDDKQLALTPEETLTLSTNRWDGASEELTMELVERTRGWPLATVSFLATKPSLKRNAFADALLTHLYRCFDMLVEEVPVEVRYQIYRISQSAQFNKISFSDERSVGLEASVNAALGDLIRDIGGGNFKFQNELRSYLRNKSLSQLGPEELHNIRQKNIEGAITSGRMEDALDDLIMAEDYVALEEFFLNYGDQIPGHRWPAATELMSRVPAYAMANRPYTLTYYGRFLGEVEPAKAVDPLRAAIDLMVSREDPLGELKACIYLLDLQVTLSQGLKLQAISKRTLELTQEFSETLSSSDQALLFTVLGAHAVYNIGDSQAVKTLLDRAEMLNAAASGEHTVRLLTFRAVDHIFHQRTSAALAQIEAVSKAESQLVRNSDHLLFYVLCANYLAMTGDAERLQAVLKESQEIADSRLLLQSQAGAIMKLFESDVTHLKGHTVAAISELTEASSNFYFVADGEVKNQWHRYMASMLASDGQHSQALSLLAEGTLSPHPVVKLRLKMVGASTQMMSGQFEAAKDMLKEALAESEVYPHMESVAHGMSYLNLLDVDEIQAKQHLLEWVKRMCDEEYPRIHYAGYSHSMVSLLLKSGFLVPEQEAFPQVARGIARNYLGKGLTATGDVIPFLTIETSSNTILTDDLELTLTKQQRRTIFLVSLMPGYAIGLEDLAERLWPDVPNPESRLYKMLSRLRSVFTAAGHEPANYIHQTPGRLELTNVKVDVCEYQSLAARSIEHGTAGQQWSATTTALSALEVWSGVFHREFHSLELPVGGYEQQYEQTCLSLIDSVLTSTTKTNRLIAALMRRHLADPSNVPVALGLATLFRASDDVLSVVQLRQRVVAALRDIDLTESEVQQQLAAL